MYRLCVSEHFDAAHYIEGYDGRCANLHGHRWRVELFLTFQEVNKIGMAVDFRVVKSVLRDLLPDHQCLNNVYEFNPTAENLAYYLFQKLKGNYGLERVRVWESPECYAEYDENDTAYL